jgi:ATP-binding cassette subfamily F protein 2
MAPDRKSKKKVASKGGADVDYVTNSLKETVIDNGRSCTGVLTSHPESRDAQISSFTLLFHGHQLLVDAELELNFGRCVPHSFSRFENKQLVLSKHCVNMPTMTFCRRYGLLGANGCGKSTMLKAIVERDIPIPKVRAEITFMNSLALHCTCQSQPLHHLI